MATGQSQERRVDEVTHYDTNLEEINRHFDGFRIGSTVTIIGDSGAHSEHVLYSFLDTRPTLYLTNGRRPSQLQEALNEIYEDPTLNIREFDNVDADALSSLIPEQGNVVLDPINTLETRPAAEYRKIVQSLNRDAAENNSLVFLHGTDSEYATRRSTTLLLSDYIVHVKTNTEDQSFDERVTFDKLYGTRSMDRRYFVMDSDLVPNVQTTERMST